MRRFADSALVADTGSPAEAHALAAAATGAGWPGVEDVVVGYRSVTVVADPTAADLDAVHVALAAIEAVALPPSAPRAVVVPVAFDGPDLEEVAERARSSPAGVIEQLAEARFEVAFLGFLPGFAYLDGLPPPLAAVPRRATPRAAVPAGSVALAGGFAAIYPQASPGGWQLVGRTGFALFDPEAPPFATLRPGDTVRLQPVDDPGTPAPRPRPRPGPSGGRAVVVEATGMLSTVQDLGRVGVAALGVPRAGAADPFALRAANRLVGNADGAAAVEITALGPALRFTDRAHVAVVGPAEVTVDGRPVSADAVVPLEPGQVLSVGRVLGDLRAYVAVGGGIDTAPVLGSRSSDVLTGLGPGPLRVGDVLGLGRATRPRGRMVRAGTGTPGAGRVLRVVPGPDDFGPAVLERLAATTWEVGPDSDRVGVRLAGDTLEPPAPGIASRGVVTGAVQVPADGRPVALLCDHATVGGYPVVATVVSADVGVLGQCRPGDRVRVAVVSDDVAGRARREAERALDGAVVGWYPVRSD